MLVAGVEVGALEDADERWAKRGFAASARV